MQHITITPSNILGVKNVNIKGKIIGKFHWTRYKQGNNIICKGEFIRVNQNFGEGLNLDFLVWYKDVVKFVKWEANKYAN